MSELNSNEKNITPEEETLHTRTPEDETVNELEDEAAASTDAHADTEDPSDPSSAEGDSEQVAEKTETKNVAKKKKGSFLGGAVEYVEIFVFAVCFVVLLFSFCFRLCTVDGGSMENTLYGGEKLIVSNLFYTPEEGDIIVFHQTGELNEPVVKRVIATEGDTVRVIYSKSSMTITITDQDGNTHTLEEPYVKYEGAPLYFAETVYTVPEGHLFVLGDNRNNSKDSRHPDIGMVDERRVLGRVILRVQPADRFGTVE